MLIIATALYPEALPFIEYYKLKKDPAHTKFQVFSNADISLIITRTGSINAAIGVTALCSGLELTPGDIFLNVGICGAIDKKLPLGSAYFCNKIIQAETGRCYYPDMLYRHPFSESSILTNSHPLKALPLEEASLADMECAGMYQAGSYFFKSHQMHFIKIVSDHLCNLEISQAQVTDLINNHVPAITSWLEKLLKENSAIKPFFTKQEETCIKELSLKLKLTRTMEHQLYQLCRYYKLKVTNNLRDDAKDGLLDFLSDYLNNIPDTLKIKTEGKMYFELFRKRIV